MNRTITALISFAMAAFALQAAPFQGRTATKASPRDYFEINKTTSSILLMMIRHVLKKPRKAPQSTALRNSGPQQRPKKVLNSSASSMTGAPSLFQQPLSATIPRRLRETTSSRVLQQMPVCLSMANTVSCWSTQWQTCASCTLMTHPLHGHLPDKLH